MKHSNLNKMKQFITCVVLIMGLTMYSQEDISFSFENPQITNDGADNFYEVDVMMKITSSGSLKLGSGQLYFNYNTAAFGENIGNTSAFQVSFPDTNDIIAQKLDAAPVPFYGDFITNNNTNSRVSWAFSQKYSSVTITNDNVLTASKRLIHLKLKFVDVGEEPMLSFEDGNAFDDLFFTACGSASNSDFESHDCTNFSGIQLTNDTFDNNNAVLGTDEFIDKLTEFSVYPNPANNLLFVDINKSSTYKLIDMLGKTITAGILVTGENSISLKKYNAGVYFIHVTSDFKVYTKRVIRE